jgi:hypothetical protein
VAPRRATGGIAGLLGSIQAQPGVPVPSVPLEVVLRRLELPLGDEALGPVRWLALADESRERAGAAGLIETLGVDRRDIGRPPARGRAPVLGRQVGVTPWGRRRDLRGILRRGTSPRPHPGGSRGRGYLKRTFAARALNRSSLPCPIFCPTALTWRRETSRGPGLPEAGLLDRARYSATQTPKVKAPYRPTRLRLTRMRGMAATSSAADTHSSPRQASSGAP